MHLNLDLISVIYKILHYKKKSCFEYKEDLQNGLRTTKRLLKQSVLGGDGEFASTEVGQHGRSNCALVRSLHERRRGKATKV